MSQAVLLLSCFLSFLPRSTSRLILSPRVEPISHTHPLGSRESEPTTRPRAPIHLIPLMQSGANLIFLIDARLAPRGRAPRFLLGQLINRPSSAAFNSPTEKISRKIARELQRLKSADCGGCVRFDYLLLVRRNTSTERTEICNKKLLNWIFRVVKKFSDQILNQTCHDNF
jgi:hypothetical protein